MWSDNETLIDLVGFRVHADLIREVVTDSKLLPVTIGVFGDWGSGKTSIMHMLRRDLDSQEKSNAPHAAALEGVVVLYFNGWLFEGCDDAKSALLTSILAQLAEHQRFGPKVRDRAVALLEAGQLDARGQARLYRGGPARRGGLRHRGPECRAFPGRVAGQNTRRDRPRGTKRRPFFPTGQGRQEVRPQGPGPGGPGEQRSDRRALLPGGFWRDAQGEHHPHAGGAHRRPGPAARPSASPENLEAIKLFLNVENTAFVIGAD